MRASPVAGLATDSCHHGLVILVEAKVFFIDFSRHGIHVAGHTFFWFGVTGEVQVVRGAVGGWGMTKTAFNAKGRLKGLHGTVQGIVADIPWQYLQISLRRLGIFSGTDS